MTIKLEDIKPGDRVTLKEGVVTAARKDGGRFPLSIRIGNENWNDIGSFALSSIATHTPAPREFKDRDEVLCASFPNVRFRIIAVNGRGAAWIEDSEGYNFTSPISDLRHADPAPAPQEAPAKERKKIEGWLNVYPSHSAWWTNESRWRADDNASLDRIACLHVVGYEGEGL